MGSSVDKRIVEMQFDNKQFEKGVSTSLSSIENLKKGLNFDQSVRSIGGISAAFKAFTLGRIGDDVSNINQKFSILGAAGFRVIQKLTDATINWGKQIINSVTGLEAAKAGLAEYETQINAIQTILANTSTKGTTLDDVKSALGELNTYADKTIYNFTEMTRNIGTFTAAGVELDTSVTAIKGIANLAAVSGSNSQQAATAMYQLSQAIAAGTIRLQDWNSVTNAGMGGEIFQEALKDTARVHGIAIDEMIEKEGGFRTSLDQNWLSSQVLLDTLAKFTGDLNEEQLLAIGYTQQEAQEIMKLGEMANDAATKVKTFTQLKDTLKEMAQSGWTKTWELIIGDFEVAKELFTGLSDTLGVFIQNSADSRNRILQVWSGLGGRDVIIMAITNAFNLLLKVLEPIKEAFTDIFPPLTGKQLMNFSYLLLGLVNRIKITAFDLENIKRIFKGVFSIIDIGKMFVLKLTEAFIKLISPLTSLSGGFLNMLGNVGDWLTGLRDAIKAGDLFGKALGKVVEFVLALIGWLVLGAAAIRDFFVKMGEGTKKLGDVKAPTKITSLWQGVVTVFESLSNSIKSLGGKIGPMFDKFKNVDVSKLTDRLNKFKETILGLDKVTAPSGKALNGFQLALEKLQPVLDKIKQFAKDAFAWLGKVIKQGLSELSFENMLKAINTALLGVFTLGAKGVFNDLSKLLTGGFLVAITTAVTNFINKGAKVFDGVSGILDGVQGSLTAWQNSLKAKTLMEIAKAIGLIALSVLALSFVDATKLAYATGAITVLFADLLASFALFQKIGGGGLLGTTTLVTALMSISSALLVMSVSLLILSKIDWEQMKSGMAGMAGIATILVVTAKLLSKNSGSFLKATIGLTSFAVGILALSGVMYLLGKMDPTVIQQGLLGLGVLMGEFVIFSRLVGNPANALAGAAAMTIMAGGIYILSESVKKLGDMKPEVLKQGLIGMSAGLLILFAALRIMPADMTIKAIALLGLGFALTLLAKSMTEMGSMSWDEVARGLTLLGGALLILAGGLRLMSGAISGAAALLIASFALEKLAGALGIMGQLPLNQLGTALLAITGIFVILGVAGLVLGPLVPVLLGLGAAMLLFGIAALAFGAGLSMVAAGMTVLAASGAAGIAVFALFVTTFLTMLPMMVTQLGLALVAFIDVIINAAPKIFEAVKVLLLGMIDTLVSVIPELTVAAVTIITALVDALLTTVPMIIEAGLTLITSLLTSIRDHIGDIVTLAIDIVLAFLDAIASKIPDIVTGATDLIVAFIDGMTQAVETEIPRIVASVKGLGKAVIDGLLSELGEGAVADILAAITGIGSAMIRGLKNILNVKSPSREFAKIGKLTNEGLEIGLKKSTPGVLSTVKDVGQKTVSTLADSISKISEVVSDNTDMTPTIRPVMDLTDIIEKQKEMEKRTNDMQSSFKIDATMQKAKIAANSKVDRYQISSDAEGLSKNISFVQYNYSPEALSRFEIYRQTKNQLALLKGALRP
jgi:tape measure domain-containing protein